MDQLETILALMKLPGVGPARLRRALWAISKAKLPIADAFSESGRRLLANIGVGSTSPSVGVAAVAERLRQDDVHVIVAPFQELELSEFSRTNLPPVIFAKGALRLLGKPSVGFCGSRAATDRGLAVADDIAEQVTQNGINVVSGGAKGVDMTAHRTSLAQRGTTTVVLAEGVLEHRMRAELREVFDPARTLLVSEFFPDDRWMTGRAMQRNRTICALSRALVLIEARSTGGTFAAGQAALEMGLPLFTADYSAKHEGNDGNRILLDRGAHRLRQSRSTGRANTRDLLAVVQNSPPEVRSAKDPEERSADGQQDLWNGTEAAGRT